MKTKRLSRFFFSLPTKQESGNIMKADKVSIEQNNIQICLAHVKKAQKQKQPEGGAKYRHELKYLCRCTDIPVLTSRLSGIVSLDSHVEEKGYYHIRSLYFDDYQNTCYKMNEAGVDKRMKYRIRIYNNSPEKITLEKKIKVHGMTRKVSAPLTKEQCELLIQGKKLSIKQEDLEAYPTLLKEFLVWMASRNGQPKVIVAYDRIPYIYKQGNVRITIDKNIQSSRDFAHFFDKNMQACPILPKGQVLLEVKYDEFLPEFLKERLEIGKLRQTTFSKYYLCRKFFSLCL